MQIWSLTIGEKDKRLSLEPLQILHTMLQNLDKIAKLFFRLLSILPMRIWIMILVKKSTMGQQEKLLIDYTEKLRSGVLRYCK